jgi:hypothetical protein
MYAFSVEMVLQTSKCLINNAPHNVWSARRRANVRYRVTDAAFKYLPMYASAARGLYFLQSNELQL